ncbi:MAG: helix-turn-helix domain-containing protein [Flavobacterium sp.]|nr:helix-turn-helix domain-containing protein [Flavobacterium sp.]
MKSKKKKNDGKSSKQSKLLSKAVTSKKTPLKKNLTLWYDNADAKMALNISDSTLSRLRKAEKIPFLKIGGKYYYPRDYFEKSMLQQVQHKHLITRA